MPLLSCSIPSESQRNLYTNMRSLPSFHPVQSPTSIKIRIENLWANAASEENVRHVSLGRCALQSQQPTTKVEIEEKGKHWDCFERHPSIFTSFSEEQRL